MATSVLGDVKSTIDTTASKAASTATGIASSGVSTIGTATSMVSPTSTTTTSTISGASTLGALPLDSARIVPAGVVWRWVDHVMRKEGGQAAVGWKPLKGLEDPSLEFTDGIKLIRLIETMSGHRAPTPFNLNPAGLNEFDSVDNLRLAFRMLRSEGFEPGFKHVYLYKPGPQRLHLLMDLLWRIMLHFRFFTHALGNTAGVASMSDEERLGLTREHLLNWVRQTTSRHIDTYRMKRIENLYHGWDDGLIYLILLHEYDPSIVSHEDLRSYSLPNQRAKSFATASSLAKRHLGIPKLLITDQGVIDEHANIAYLAEFWYSFHQRQLRSGGTSYGIETARAPRVEERYELGRTERMQRLMEGSQGSITRIGTTEQQYGLLPHEEERLRADQMRLEAEAERKRAEEERLKAFEARRKAESDKIAAEEEARRAMERREIALREKERLEAERRNADEERRQHLEAMRRSEVERLKMEQERKRLEDEVRRVEEERTRALMFSRQAEQDRRLIEEQSRLSESERLRTEEIRRMAQLKMEEAEREKLRAAEERRLAREEMLLAEQEMRIAEEERKRAELERHRYEREGLYYEGRRESTYLTTAATMPAPRIATPTTTTTRIIETARPLPPVPATPIATTVTPIVSTAPVVTPAPTGAVRSVVVTPSVAPTTTTTTTTTHVISIEEKKRRKAERKARRAEEERLHAEKLRRKEEKRRLRAEAERKRLEDYVVMTQTVLVGVLHAHVVEARGLGKGVHKPYAKVKLEKQKMRTKTIKRTLIPQWRSDYTFYHSDPDARLKVRVYDKGGRFGGKRFIGRVDIPMKDLTDGVEQDLWYPLHYKASHEKKRRLKEKRKREKERYKGWIPEEVRAWRGDEQLGEIHLKLLYRKDPLYSKPGVVHDVL